MVGAKGHLLSVLTMWFPVFQLLVNHFLTNLLGNAIGQLLAFVNRMYPVTVDPHGRWSDTTFGTCLVIGKFLEVDHKSTQLMILSHWERYWLNLWLANKIARHSFLLC